MGVSKPRSPNIDPKEEGSYHKDTRKGPPMYGNSHIMLSFGLVLVVGLGYLEGAEPTLETMLGLLGSSCGTAPDGLFPVIHVIDLPVLQVLYGPPIAACRQRQERLYRKQ